MFFSCKLISQSSVSCFCFSPWGPSPQGLSKVPSRPHYEEKAQEGSVQKEHMQLFGQQQWSLSWWGLGEGRGMTSTDVRLKTCEPPALCPPSPAASVSSVHSPDVHPGPRMCTYISRGILNLALSSSLKCVCVCVWVSPSCSTLRPHGLAHRASLSMKFSRQEYWSALLIFGKTNTVM